MEYRFSFASPVSTERVSGLKAVAHRLQRVDFGDRTDVSKLDQARAMLNNWSQAIGAKRAWGEDGEFPVRESDRMIAAIIATAEVLNEAINAPAIAVALPRRPAGLTILSIPKRIGRKDE